MLYVCSCVVLEEETKETHRAFGILQPTHNNHLLLLHILEPN